MANYSTSKIYTIRCKTDDTKVFVGSTIQPLCKKWGVHKIDSIRNKEMPLYQAINDNWKNWYIELYEHFPCNTKEELNKRTCEVARLIGNLNTETDFKTNKQYRKEYQKQYRMKEKEHVPLYIEMAKLITLKQLENAVVRQEQKEEQARILKLMMATKPTVEINLYGNTTFFEKID